MTGPVGIIILEGGDAAGKTTLARQICERYDGLYIHATVTEDAFTHHLDVMKQAIAVSCDRLVVVDRHWISEHIYGPIMRGTSQHNLAGRCFDRVWRKHAAIYVLCAPKDTEAQLDRWRCDKAAGKEEYASDDKIASILHVYADLRDGQVGHPGNLYVDQLIRFGDFASRDDVLVYDMDEHPTKRTRDYFINGILDRLYEHRTAQYQPALDPVRTNLTGHVRRPRWLLVGEELSDCAPGPWPFFWSDMDSGATWLNQALHEIGVDETQLLITNAKIGNNMQLFQLILEDAPQDIRIVTMGRVATDAALIQDIKEFNSIPNPQWVRRFNKLKFDDYVDILREQLYANW